MIDLFIYVQHSSWLTPKSCYNFNFHSNHTAPWTSIVLHSTMDINHAAQHHGHQSCCTTLLQKLASFVSVLIFHLMNIFVKICFAGFCWIFTANYWILNRNPQKLDCPARCWSVGNTEKAKLMHIVNSCVNYIQHTENNKQCQKCKLHLNSFLSASAWSSLISDLQDALPADFTFNVVLFPSSTKAVSKYS